MSQSFKLSQDCVAMISSHELTVEHSDSQLKFHFNSVHSRALSSHFKLAEISCVIEPHANMLGDGFQMLAQTAGLVECPREIGRCPDNSAIYRIYPQSSPKRYYNYLVLEQSSGFTLFGFTSCRRFSGYFELDNVGSTGWISAYIDGEETSPQNWETNQLESLCVLQASDLDSLYSEYSRILNRNHQPRAGAVKKTPVGWCSWYAYYADVNENNIHDNLDCMNGELADIEWVLLDDGYQAFMGDWLTPSNKFPSGVKELIAKIKNKGKKPAIWLAPFIVQAESEVYQQNPNWFVRNKAGDHLVAEEITYGGWRCTPWYILDTSNHEVQEHLTHVFRTMREEWGIELFKLDANYWGTLKGNRLQRGITGVEAYRLGMEAIAEGAGEAWLLGCNAPMWPSLGTVDAMRVSDDVERRPSRFEQIAKETFYRSWQHRKLWQIDPDCATFTSLANQSTDRASYEFHRDAILTSSGLLLSGDPLPDMVEFGLASFSKLVKRQKINPNSASFSSLNLNHASLPLGELHQLHCIFNYGEGEKEFTLTSEKPTNWYDFWSGEKLNLEPSAWLEVSLAGGLTSKAIVTGI
ncbi:glycoside hydrolase family 36 protein [Vibrio profundi]|uniref:glycoside hydrolase family 36 protein n=1 Tax=Vibrio profundi TaxID=1774960 RepID=UPI0037363B03